MFERRVHPPLARSKSGMVRLGASATLSSAGPLSGQRLGHYRIGRLLGRGGHGEVYRASCAHSERTLAIKVLAPEGGERMIGEALAQQQVVHPRVCRVFDIAREHRPLFIALEYIDGETVLQRLKRRGPFAPALALELVRMAAAGLQAAWERGVLHRDIKPSNLMLTRDNQLKLIDFGGAHPSELYLAPEIQNAPPRDFRSDLYSLGATLHHMLAGAPPFTGSHPMEVLAAHLADPPPRLEGGARRRARWLMRVEALRDQMMAKRPEDRFDGYGALVSAVDALL